MYLRPYQHEAVDSIYQYFMAGNTGNPIIAMPTGTGKSVVQAAFFKRALMESNCQRMLSLTHVQELVDQNCKTLNRIWPMAPVGINSAGLNRRDVNQSIIFGGIQSVVKDPYVFGPRDIIFIDEAQLISPNDNSMYRKFLAAQKEMNPNVKAIGLTATPFRMGQGMLTDPPLKGGDRLFTDICFDITGVEPFNKLLDDIYLAPLIPKQTAREIDISEVGVVAGELNQTQLERAIQSQDIIDDALDEAMDIAKDRHVWLVFASGVKNCEDLKDKLINRGIYATAVHSKINKDERNKRLAGFKNGTYRALVVNNIGTVGFDHPPIDCIIDLRPTTSVVLHIQKYGRGTRPFFHPSFTWEQLQDIDNRRAAIEMSVKKNCLVLDFAGNTKRLGPINDPRVPKPRGKGTGDVPVKICPECGAYNHTPARNCCDCGYEFIFKTKIKTEAGTDELIKRVGDPDISYFDVSLMAHAIHKKQGKPDSLKVNYFAGNQLFPLYLGFAHKGYARNRAVNWWRQHSSGEAPSDAKEAFERFGECRQTKTIKVQTDGQYPEILEFQF